MPSGIEVSMAGAARQTLPAAGFHGQPGRILLLLLPFLQDAICLAWDSIMPESDGNRRMHSIAISVSESA